jgi:hypothetical protein
VRENVALTTIRRNIMSLQAIHPGEHLDEELTALFVSRISCR